MLFRLIIQDVIEHSVALDHISEEDGEKHNVDHVDDYYLNENLVLALRNVVR